MKRKLFCQSNFRLDCGRSKHVDKQYNNNTNIIYSRSTYKSALQKSCTYIKYCKLTFGVRYLQDLKPDYFMQFIKDKQYTKNTANSYKWAIKKLQNCYNSKHSLNQCWINEDFKNRLVDYGEQRKQLPREIHDRIIERAYENKYENGLAFEVARALGLRVSEITNLRMKDFKFNEYGVLKGVYIHSSKGGRDRLILTKFLIQNQIESVIKAYKHFEKSRNEADRLFINKSDSYRKAFSNARDFVSKNYVQCSIHSLRKEFASDYYSREIEKNRPKKTVMMELTRLLGHNRIDVLKHYL